jgi:hypothetical protein
MTDSQLLDEVRSDPELSKVLDSTPVIESTDYEVVE